MSTLDVIAPILHETYGTGAMVDRCAEVLAERIDTYDFESPGADLGRMIRNVCWDWFTGGTTAESVAKRIQAALAGDV